MRLNDLAKTIHRKHAEIGWWDDVPSDERFLKFYIATKIGLIFTEVAEMLEGYRKDLPDDHLPHRPMIEVEAADTIIRICDLMAFLGHDLEGAIMEKVEYNTNRADHKSEVRAGKHGKKF